MLKKFLPLAAGAALLTLASAASAAQPLSDSQMDGVTAGTSPTTFATATGYALAFGEFQADTATQTSTNVVQGTANPLSWIAQGVAQTQAIATGGALFNTAVQVQSQTSASL